MTCGPRPHYKHITSVTVVSWPAPGLLLASSWLLIPPGSTGRSSHSPYLETGELLIAVCSLDWSAGLSRGALPHYYGCRLHHTQLYNMAMLMLGIVGEYKKTSFFLSTVKFLVSQSASTR